MLKLKQADLFETFESLPNSFLVHCCNCFHTMGAGVAAEVRRRYPEAYRADLETPRGDPRKLGTTSSASVGNRRVFNLYGQFSFGGGRDLDYDALERGLRVIAAEASKQSALGIRTVIVTYKIGCGLAGGDWGEVFSILDRVGGEYDVDIVVADKSFGAPTTQSPPNSP